MADAIVKTTSPGKISQAIEAGKGDLANAAWRTAASQAVKLARDPALAALKRAGLGEEVAGPFLASSLGEAVLSSALGIALGATTQNPKMNRLGEELRIKGVALITDEIAESFLGPLRDGIVSLIANLPEANPRPDAT